MLRDPLHKTLTERRGHSAVEYAIVLGLVTVIVAGGVAWLGASSIRMLSPLAGQTTGPAPASPAARTDGESAHPVGQLSPEASPQAAERTAPATLAMLAFALGIVGLGYFLLILQRRKAPPLDLPDDGQPSNLDERLGARRQDLLRLLSQDPAVLFKNQLSVRHLMTTELITVTPGASRRHIAEVMRQSRIRHLLVCDPERQLLGIVSDRDLSGKPGKTAEDLMGKRLKVVSPETLASPAITYLIQSGISSLPVVEEGRLCGILTTTDMILALQCVLQLWLHAAAMMHSEAWERELMQAVQSRLADGDATYGAAGVLQSLMAGAAQDVGS